MSYTEVTGDLFELGLPAVGHGCNGRGGMGGGIAKDFRLRYPAMYEEYADRCARGAFPLGGFFRYEAPEFDVYNLGTQVQPGAHADLAAISTSVAAALTDVADRRLGRLGLPRIGAGIGGLAWDDVAQTLRALAADSPVELVVVRKPGPKQPSYVTHAPGRQAAS